MNLSIEHISEDYLFSPISIDYDTRPAEIHSFIPYAKPRLMKEFVSYVKTLPSKDSHRLIRNYLHEDFMNHHVVSLWKRGGQPVGFATAWNRPFYQSHSIRVLNRIYHDAQLSRVHFTREVGRPATIHCLLHQLYLVKKAGFDFAFISREMRASRFFKNFINKLSDYSESPWMYQKGPFLLAPSDTPDCHHSIGVTPLTNRLPLEQFFRQWKEV